MHGDPECEATPLRQVEAREDNDNDMKRVIKRSLATAKNNAKRSTVTKNVKNSQLNRCAGLSSTGRSARPYWCDW